MHKAVHLDYVKNWNSLNEFKCKAGFKFHINTICVLVGLFYFLLYFLYSVGVSFHWGLNFLGFLLCHISYVSNQVGGTYDIILMT